MKTLSAGKERGYHRRRHRSGTAIGHPTNKTGPDLNGFRGIYVLTFTPGTFFSVINTVIECPGPDCAEINGRF